MQDASRYSPSKPSQSPVSPAQILNISQNKRQTEIFSNIVSHSNFAALKDNNVTPVSQLLRKEIFEKSFSDSAVEPRTHAFSEILQPDFEFFAQRDVDDVPAASPSQSSAGSESSTSEMVSESFVQRRLSLSFSNQNEPINSASDRLESIRSAVLDHANPMLHLYPVISDASFRRNTFVLQDDRFGGDKQGHTDSLGNDDIETRTTELPPFAGDVAYSKHGPLHGSREEAVVAKSLLQNEEIETLDEFETFSYLNSSSSSVTANFQLQRELPCESNLQSDAQGGPLDTAFNSSGSVADEASVEPADFASISPNKQSHLTQSSSEFPAQNAPAFGAQRLHNANSAAEESLRWSNATRTPTKQPTKNVSANITPSVRQRNSRDSPLRVPTAAGQGRSTPFASFASARHATPGGTHSTPGDRQATPNGMPPGQAQLSHPYSLQHHNYIFSWSRSAKRNTSAISPSPAKSKISTNCSSSASLVWRNSDRISLAVRGSSGCSSFAIMFFFFFF